MTLARAALVVAVVVAGVAGCQRSEEVLSGHQPTRQADLSERLLRFAATARTGSPEVREDAARALAEVVMPTQSPRLRLFAAGDDPVLADGAAEALARILVRRDPAPEVLRNCAKSETNSFVRARCLARWTRRAATSGASAVAELVAALGSGDEHLRAAAVGLVVAHGAALAPGREALVKALELPTPVAELARARAALERTSDPAPVLASPGDTKALLESPELPRRRDALRRLLAAESVPGPELTAPLVHALESDDAQLRHLAEAVFLRRSLEMAPPPAEAAVPRPLEE